MVFALAGDSTITRCRPPSPAADAAGFLTAGFLVVGFLLVGFLLVDFAMRHFGGWGRVGRGTGCWPCHVFFGITTMARRRPLQR